MGEFRDPSDYELKLVTALLSSGFPGAEQLAQQLEGSKVRRIDEEGSLRFYLAPGAGEADVPVRVPVEAASSDCDGVGLHVLLHVVGGRVTELEFYREDGNPIQRLPPITEWEVVALPE